MDALVSATGRETGCVIRPSVHCPPQCTPPSVVVIVGSADVAESVSRWWTAPHSCHSNIHIFISPE